jgi:hypothetical protein
MNNGADQPGVSPLQRWQNGHWLFSVLLQGLILAHKQLALALQQQDWPAVNAALTDATQLWWTCAAAFHFAGDFSRAAYTDIVRPSMEPPHEREGFSGLLSVDHHYLVKHLRALKPLLETLPVELQRRHRTYLWALDAMYESHAWVCAFHVGRGGSLKDPRPAQDSIRHLKTRSLEAVGRLPQPLSLSLDSLLADGSDIGTLINADPH